MHKRERSKEEGHAQDRLILCLFEHGIVSNKKDAYEMRPSPASFARNPPDQLFQRVRVRLTKIDPPHPFEEEGQPKILRSIWEDNRNHRTGTSGALIQEGIHL